MQRRRLMTEGRKAAAALKYRMGKDPAPRLVAKGAGKIAERIIAAAKEAGVPLREDPDLLALLMTLEIGETIPPELYAAVAEVLAFVYRMNGRTGEVR
ncbi:MAG: EscU/YscU/HrcU family type III secretion system export apparatus switch protein [Candidatus Latescibacterota bacterium]